MGKPAFFAVPVESDFERFRTLFSEGFLPAKYRQFLDLVDLEADIQTRLGRRVICVPLHVPDFADWLDGRKATPDLWLAYAADRAAARKEWPPVPRMYFPLTGDQ